MFDICVIGLGRVGLPLFLSLEAANFKVCGIDTNIDLIDRLVSKEMPFEESGCDELLSKSNAVFGNSYGMIQLCPTIIVTVGTPIIDDDEINYNYIKVVIDEIIKNYHDGIHIILRSTVAPNTNEKLIEYIEKQLDKKLGEDFFFSYCPERLIEGNALFELGTLPQLVGHKDIDDLSFKYSKEIFSKITKEKIIACDFIEAELTKVFLNASRYAYFGIINYLFMIAELYSVDIYKLLQLSNYNYPRKILGQPGFTAGTCLKKDYKMLNPGYPFCDLFANVAKINEAIPSFIITMIKNKWFANEMNIGILGYSFKKGSDDTRDSLSKKLIRCAEGIFPDSIRVNDPYVKKEDVDSDHIQYWTDDVKELILRSNVIIIATNHEVYAHEKYKKELQGKQIVDIWNLTGKQKVFQLKEVQACWEEK